MTGVAPEISEADLVRELADKSQYLQQIARLLAIHRAEINEHRREILDLATQILEVAARRPFNPFDIGNYK